MQKVTQWSEHCSVTQLRRHQSVFFSVSIGTKIVKIHQEVRELQWIKSGTFFSMAHSIVVTKAVFGACNFKSQSAFCILQQFISFANIRGGCIQKKIKRIESRVSTRDIRCQSWILQRLNGTLGDASFFDHANTLVSFYFLLTLSRRVSPSRILVILGRVNRP